MSLPWVSTSSHNDGLAEIYAPVRSELEQVENLLRSYLVNGLPFARRLMEHGLQLGGKRLRPAVVLLAGQACGRLRPEHFLMGAVIELIHTATLVHDDVLDEAKHRRHLQTINTRWDTETSILLGDYLFTIAIELTARLGDGFISNRVSQAGRRLCEGELRQVCERGNFDLTEEDYLEIIEAKTAELYACSAEIGAYLAEAAEDIRHALGRFGRKIGIAFQIIDDVLDIAGDERVAGKSLGTDYLKQKATLPVIRLLQVASPETRPALLTWLRSPSVDNIARLQDELERSQSLVYAREKARQFVQSAMEDLRVLPPSPAREALCALARFVVARDR
ncbi:MAG: polyprenyl synthetase family protein [Thermoguttaceae bacterium]|nr:polyprenyl synthetase family protein [Thermoguttaceae bacterium]MDW8079481.1 polyprenyl synthetase family protein [Thermoguttaceae bacterium]